MTATPLKELSRSWNYLRGRIPTSVLEGQPVWHGAILQVRATTQWFGAIAIALELVVIAIVLALLML